MVLNLLNLPVLSLRMLHVQVKNKASFTATKLKRQSESLFHPLQKTGSDIRPATEPRIIILLYYYRQQKKASRNTLKN